MVYLIIIYIKSVRTQTRREQENTKEQHMKNMKGNGARLREAHYKISSYLSSERRRRGPPHKEPARSQLTEAHIRSFK